MWSWGGGSAVKTSIGKDSPLNKNLYILDVKATWKTSLGLQNNTYSLSPTWFATCSIVIYLTQLMHQYWDIMIR